jgi:hypothetical protein
MMPDDWLAGKVGLDEAAIGHHGRPLRAISTRRARQQRDAHRFEIPAENDLAIGRDFAIRRDGRIQRAN